ncbi:transcriptional regulator, LuxR family [Vibrio cholerae]|nr:transcriptional regulator, LuxR family [Vibrio cholerae]
MKDENKLNVRMLSDVCMQSRLLKEALESKLPLALEITPFSELWLEENKPESRSIQMLVIDYSRISEITARLSTSVVLMRKRSS